MAGPNFTPIPINFYSKSLQQNAARPSNNNKTSGSNNVILGTHRSQNNTPANVMLLVLSQMPELIIISQTQEIIQNLMLTIEVLIRIQFKTLILV